jgi:hypothetical protein
MLDWFANPSLLWLGLLAVPVILLFMLKHKPVVKRVASTLLWAGAAQLNVATSPFSRLRRSLSLLLMLLLLLCLVLALAGFRIPDARSRGLPLIIVIDTTASMQTSTLDGTRLELARERAAELINAVGDAPITLLVWNGSLLLASPADCEPGVAKRALSKIGASDQGASDEALLLSLKPHFESKRKQRVALISDHRPGSTNAEYVFVPAGAPAANAGIVAAGISDAGAQGADLFFGIELHGAERRRVTVKLERVEDSSDKAVFDVADVRDVSIATGQRSAASFHVTRPGLYRAHIEQEDALAADNEAYLRYTPADKLPVVFMSPPPESLKKVIESIDFIYEEKGAADPSRAALIFHDVNAKASANPAIARLPAAYIGSAVPGVSFSAPYDASDFAARPARSFLWRGAGVPDIRIGSNRNVETSAYLQPLLEAGSGTAMGLLARENSPLYDLVVGFNLDDEKNNFKSKYAFVIFWTNWFEYVRGLLEPLPVGPVRSAEAVEVVKLEGRGEFSYERLGSDDGKNSALPGDVLAMDRIGVYRFSGLTETRVPLVGVSLLDPLESDTALATDEPYDADLLNAQLEEFSKDAQSARADYDLRPWLALLGLLLLLFDWFWFRRRFPLNAQPVPASKAKRGVTALRKRQAGA